MPSRTLWCGCVRGGGITSRSRCDVEWRECVGSNSHTSPSSLSHASPHRDPPRSCTFPLARRIFSRRSQCSHRRSSSPPPSLRRRRSRRTPLRRRVSPACPRCPSRSPAAPPSSPACLWLLWPPCRVWRSPMRTRMWWPIAARTMQKNEIEKQKKAAEVAKRAAKLRRTAPARTRR